jgi:hypothetical protein
MEQYYSPAEVAKVLAISPKMARNLIASTSDSIRIGAPTRREGKKNVRRYYTYRISASVLSRLLSKLMV